MHVDTSFLVDLLREKKRRQPTATPAHDLLARLSPSAGLSASVFVICELEVGVRLAGNHPADRKAVSVLRDSLRIVYPDQRFASGYADLYAALEQQRRRIGVIDVAIAAMALEEDEPLITANTKHFERVPGLEIISHKS